LRNQPARTELTAAKPIRVDLAKEALAGVESDRF